MNRTAQIILSLIVGLVSFLIFIIVLFPLDTMISHYLSELEKQTKGNQNLKVSVSAIDASLLFDTHFKEFRFYKDGQEVFYAPSMSANISLMPLISGAVHAGFKATYDTGVIKGKVNLASDSVVDIDIQNMALSDLSYLTQMMSQLDVPLELSGLINGSLYFAWSSDLRQKEAEISLRMSNSKIKGFMVKALNMQIPDLVLAQKEDVLEVEGGLDKGQITIEKIKIPGPDLVFDLNGNARMNNKNDIIRMNLDGKFSFSAGLVESLPFIAMIEGQKSPDGSFPLSVRGSLSNPNLKIGEMDLTKLLKF